MYVLLGRAVTEYRWGGSRNILFMRHKLLVLTVKKVLQSVYIYRSYRKIKTGVPFFWTTRYVPSTALPIQFLTQFCCRMYRLATKQNDWVKSWQSSTPDFRHQKQSFHLKLYISKHYMLTPHNVLYLYRTSYAVRSAITVATELLVKVVVVKSRQSSPQLHINNVAGDENSCSLLYTLSIVCQI